MVIFPGETNTTSYESANEAIHYFIEPSLGEFVNDFDVEAIFDEVFVWDEVSETFMLCVDVETFWRLVEKHDISGKVSE